MTNGSLAGRHDFLKLWGGQSVSLLGSQVTVLALPLAAIYTLHAGAFEVGLLGVAQWVPFVVLSLPVGALSDRRRRGPLLIGADTVRAAILAGVVVLAAAGALTMALLVGAALGLGVCTVIFEVSYTSYVPAVVERPRLIAANSRLQASASVAQLAGPGLGGLLVQLVSAPNALIADALAFVVSALSLASISGREPLPEQAERVGGTPAQIRAGLAFTLGDRVLRALIGTSALYNLFDQWIFVLFTVFAVHELRLGAEMIGLVLSTGALGALAGSLVTGTAMRRLGVGRAIVSSVVVECVAMLAIPLAPARPALAVPILICAYTLNGAGTALSTIVALTVRQTLTPDRLLGRVNGTYRFVSYGVIALGALLGGVSGHLFGPRTGLAIGTIGLLTTIAWVLASPLRTLPAVAEHAPVAPTTIESA